MPDKATDRVFGGSISDPTHLDEVLARIRQGSVSEQDIAIIAEAMAQRSISVKAPGGVAFESAKDSVIITGNNNSVTENVYVSISGSEANALWQVIAAANKHAVTLTQPVTSALVMPLNGEEAFDLAAKTLKGVIVQAIPFWSETMKRYHIAVVRRRFGLGAPFEVAILEQLGQFARVVWQFDLEPFIFDVVSIRTVDIDGDGTPEVLFEYESAGTGWQTQYMVAYSMLRKRMFTLSQNRRLNSPTAEQVPPIEIEPDDDPVMLAALESYAVRCNFLNAYPDAGKKIAAEWLIHHSKNKHGDGSIVLRFYPGRAEYGLAGAERYETPQGTYVAFFKGPLYFEDKDQQRHAVLFASTNQYDWISWLGYYRSHVWFVVHNRDDSLFCLEHDNEKGMLRSVRLVHETSSQPLWIWDVTIEEDAFRLRTNMGEVLVRPDELALSEGLPPEIFLD